MAYLYGIASAGYMFIHPIADRDKLIEQQKEENLQVCSENKELRVENEDLKEDKEYLERKLKTIKDIANDYDTSDSKIAKIKELVAKIETNN